MGEETKALKRFDISVFLHFIGRVLYMTFIPIVLLKNGYSLNQVFIYLIGFSAITVIFLVISAKLFSKRSVMTFYILAIVAEIFLVILLIPKNISYIVLSLIILLQAAYYSYYYISYNSIIAHYNSRKRTSDNIGNLQIASSLSNIIAPLVGAVLLSINKSLFIVSAIVFLIASIIPIIKIVNTDINGSKLKVIRARKIKYELFSCGIMSSLEFIVFLLWSIFVYISGFPLIYVGLIPSIEALVQIVLLKTIKKRLVSQKFRTVAKIVSVAGIAFFSVYRFVFPQQMILTNFSIALFFTAFSLSVNSDYFEKIKNYQAYHSSILLEAIEFSACVLMGVIAWILGLKFVILVPVILVLFWMALSAKRISNALRAKKKNPAMKINYPLGIRHALIRKI